MTLIEIDGLPKKNMVIFHGELLNNQMVIFLGKQDDMWYKHPVSCVIFQQARWKESVTKPRGLRWP